MIPNEIIKFTGELSIVKTNSAGVVVDERHIPNLVVDAGKTHIISRMLGTSSASMTHMGVGTGTLNNVGGATSPIAGDTALTTALNARVAFTTTTSTATSITYTATFGTGSYIGAITEAGIFNALTGGTMLCRTVFAAVNKTTDDTIAITWVVTIA